MAKTSGLIKYNRSNREAIRKEAAKHQNRRGKYVTKLPVGKTRIRILPAALGQTHPWVVVHKHYIPVPGLSKKFVFNCPLAMQAQPCPGCEGKTKLEATGDPAKQKMAEDYEPTFQFVCNAIFREDEDAGPKVWQCSSQTIYSRIVEFMNDEEEFGETDFTDPYEGFDIIVKRVGTTQNDTTYSVELARASSPVHEDEEVMARWINDEMASMADEGKVEPYQQIMQRKQTAISRQLNPGAAATHQAQMAAARPSAALEGEVVTDDDEMSF